MANPYQTHGMFSWFELLTSDVDAAKSFYRELFDWEYQDDSSSGINYTMIKKADTEPFAGILDRKNAKADDPEQIPPCWGHYVTVNNAEETVAKAKGLGATIIVPITMIPNVGKFSVVQDPQGAVFSVFQYLME